MYSLSSDLLQYYVFKRSIDRGGMAAQDLSSLRRQCIKSKHPRVNDVTGWAQEHFRKPFNTVCHYISQLKFQTALGNHGCCALLTKERRVWKGCYQPEVQSSYVFGRIPAGENESQLAIFKLSY